MVMFSIVWARSRERRNNYGPALSSLLKKSTGCVVAWMRCQNGDQNRHFASRAKLALHLARVEKCRIFQRAARRPQSHQSGLAGLGTHTSRYPNVRKIMSDAANSVAAKHIQPIHQ